jgi:hypothetical protein
LLFGKPEKRKRQAISGFTCPEKKQLLGKNKKRSGTFALNMGVVVVVPVARLREHGEQGECEEEHLGSHAASSLQELVLVATDGSLLPFSSLPVVLWLDWSCCLSARG